MSRDYLSTASEITVMQDVHDAVPPKETLNRKHGYGPGICIFQFHSLQTHATRNTLS